MSHNNIKYISKNARQEGMMSPVRHTDLLYDLIDLVGIVAAHAQISI